MMSCLERWGLMSVVLVSLIGVGAGGRARFSISGAEWRSSEQVLSVTGRGESGSVVNVYNDSDRSLVGTAVVSRKGNWAVLSSARPVPCRVVVTSSGNTLTREVSGAPDDCGGVAAVLVGLEISGPAEIDEETSAAYGAVAAFSDGSSRDVTGTASWGEDSSYATIQSGVLQVADVPSAQSIQITASYQSSGVTRSASYPILVRDLTAPPPPPPPTGSGSHAGRITSYQGTATCLECHMDEALQVHASVHYQWKGDSPEVVDAAEGEQLGKLGGINDFCIYPDINWIGRLTNVRGELVDGGCAKCHAGLGAKPTAEASLDQLLNIDCLVCHSDSYRRTVGTVDGEFRFVPDTGNMSASLLEAAQNVGRPSSRSCLQCHAYAGGGDNYKRGDLEAAHVSAGRDLDVHMAPRTAGGAGLDCLSCHAVDDHRFAGRGSDLRPTDSSVQVSCAGCHSSAPHHEWRLDGHAKRVDCSVCHIPEFARTTPTDMDRRWDLGGELDVVKGLYEPVHVKGEKVVPEYRFWNGLSTFYRFGDPAAADPETGRVLMSGPVGAVTDPGAKLFAFKHHLASQPMDPVTARLLPLKIGIFFSTGDVNKAVVEGAKAVGWPLASHTFADTERYMGIFHEVAPSERALGCASCHNGGSRVDFAALGYTPKSTRNGKPLCASCHSDKSDEWSASEFFDKVHAKHVTDKKLDCINCHNFSAAR